MAPRWARNVRTRADAGRSDRLRCYANDNLSAERRALRLRRVRVRRRRSNNFSMSSGIRRPVFRRRRRHRPSSKTARFCKKRFDPLGIRAPGRVNRSLSFPFLASGHFATKTGHPASCTMRSARLPIKRSYIAEWPVAPITRRSAPIFAARLTTSRAG